MRPADLARGVQTLSGPTTIVSVGPATTNAATPGVTSGTLLYRQVKHLLVDRPLRHQAFRPLPRPDAVTSASDQLVGRVFDRAVDLYRGDEVSAREWFQTPIPSLGGRRPVDLSQTEAGAREVETLIYRIQHGIVS